MISSLALLVGCSVSDTMSLTQILSSANPSQALGQWASNKAVGYAANPKALVNDLERLHKLFAGLSKEIDRVWGKDQAELPQPKKYVKYTDHYQSRASIDFESGLITVETLTSTAPKQQLRKAIITTLLTPANPEDVDLFSDKAVQLKGEPFLYGQVKDQDGQSIRWPWRAEQYADYLLAHNLKIDKLRDKTRYRVQFSMVKDHDLSRSYRYASLVKQYSRQYKLSESLVYAVIQTESAFNPFAVSSAGAYGLMQVVPATAGKDVYQYVLNRQGQPSPQTLLSPQNNIEIGSGYLHLLDTRYLKKIAQSRSRHYAMISSYNGGVGATLRTFDKKQSAAFAKINREKPTYVYQQLVTHHPFSESRNYLKKVISAENRFKKGKT